MGVFTYPRSPVNFVQMPGYCGLLNPEIRKVIKRLNKLAEPEVDWSSKHFAHLYRTKESGEPHGRTSVSWRTHHVDEVYDQVYMTDKQAKEQNEFYVANYIDHTSLLPDAPKSSIRHLCAVAKQNHYYAVCVNPCHVRQCAEDLKGTNVKVASVVSFPLGASTTEMKVQEALDIIKLGASEVDMVMNIGMLKDKNYKGVLEDIRAVVKACKAEKKDAEVKVILETCLLTNIELMEASVLGVASGADYIKTSTGFSKGGATPESVDVMLAVAGDSCKVKAAGGVRTAEQVVMFLAAGVSRIGTSSSESIIDNVKKLRTKKRPSIVITASKL